MLGGLNSFFLLLDRPEVYGLPPDPKLPTRNLHSTSWWSVLGGVLVALAGVFSFRDRGRIPRNSPADRDATASGDRTRP
jgi:formate dehydrogenase iron-sulfur subunit